MQALVLANFYSVLLKRLRHLPLGCTLSLLETFQISYTKHITRSEARAAVASSYERTQAVKIEGTTLGTID